MSAQITLNWTKDSTFETLLDGHKVTIDTTAENGGNNEGPRPKALMLVALAGCSAMDVISLFLKMRVRFDKISIDVTAETSDTIPMVYTAFHATYHIDGNIGPKALMLVALAGCSAMDVISLFLKMRVRFDKISIDVTAETSDTIPMVYTAFHATYHIDGNIGDAAKIEKAIRLSQEKYCGVGLMMKKIGPITYDILLNGEPLKPQKHED